MFFSSFNNSNNEIYDFTDKCLADCFGSTDEEIYKKINSSSEHELKADYEKMINSLKKWADDNNFNMWKKSALVGNVTPSVSIVSNLSVSYDL
jgi:hypothetical protein